MNFKNWNYSGSYGTRIDLVLLILRIVFGGFMLTHGYSKLSKCLSGDHSFADPIGLGESLSLYLVIFAEFLCAILLILGLFTKLSLIPLMITMLVAVLIVHAPDPLSDKEHALLYLFAYICLFITGAGRYSLDDKMYKP